MPNLYATLEEYKATAPDSVQTTTTKYDNLIKMMLAKISRMIDGYCERVFYPSLATRYYDGDGTEEVKIDDLLEITSVEYSDDDGETYTALTVDDDYFATVEGDYNSSQSYTRLFVNPLSDEISTWPDCRRAVKITGVWGYADDRDEAWEDSLDTVENNPLAAAGTSITVNDADGVNLFGITPRFQAGQLIMMEDEYSEVTATDTAGNTLTAVRGRNGSTAAQHAQNTAIYIWRPPEPVKQACIIQAWRQIERGTQGFGDARANAELGSLMFIKGLDPEVQIMLQPYRW